jgi:hypothetical protein
LQVETIGPHFADLFLGERPLGLGCNSTMASLPTRKNDSNDFPQKTPPVAVPSQLEHGSQAVSPSLSYRNPPARENAEAEGDDKRVTGTA